MGLTDSNNCISNGLRADIMRSSMENKNLLSDKGSIYVGTGEKITVGGAEIGKTTVLPLGEAGEILLSKGGSLVYSPLIGGDDRTTEHDGLKLKQDMATGQLSLGGHINRVYKTDGETMTVTSRGEFNGKFFTKDQKNLQLKRPYHHRVYLVLNSSGLPSDFPSWLQGATFTFDFINAVSSKYEDVGELATMPVGHTTSGTDPITKNPYYDCYVTPNCQNCFLTSAVDGAIVFYIHFHSQVTSSGETATATISYFDSDAILDLSFRHTKEIASYVTVKDVVTYVDTGEEI